MMGVLYFFEQPKDKGGVHVAGALDRIERSADRIADLRAAIRAEMVLRDSAICEAINDERRKYKVVAAAARMTAGTVAQIVAKDDPLRRP